MVGAGFPGVLDDTGQVGIGQHDHRQRFGCLVRAQFPEHFHSAQLGEHQVQDHHVRLELFHGGQARFAIGGQFHLETFHLESMAVNVADDFVVLDYQHFLHREPAQARIFS